MSDIVNVYNIFESGEEYLRKLQDEVNRTYPIVLSHLGSYYKSKGDGPFYARHMKILTVMVSKIKLQLDSVHQDVDLSKTRGEFIPQFLSSIAFPDGSPDLDVSENDFRDFLVNTIHLYFKGSTLESIRKAMGLITDSKIIVHENLDDRMGKIDDFTFDIDVIIDDPANAKLISKDPVIKTLLDMIRPAHTIYRIKYIMEDSYVGQKTDGLDHQKKYYGSNVGESFYMKMDSYFYEDFRKNFGGIKFVDSNGVLESKYTTESIEWE